jgi:hypothetical protein
MSVVIKENVWKASVYVIQELLDMIAVKGTVLIIVMEEEVLYYYYYYFSIIIIIIILLLSYYYIIIIYYFYNYYFIIILLLLLLLECMNGIECRCRKNFYGIACENEYCPNNCNNRG